jgi:hypothetical protein
MHLPAGRPSTRACAERQTGSRPSSHRNQDWCPAMVRAHKDPAALRPQPRRDGPDFWATPPCLTTALIRHVLPILPCGPVWEPACGDGRLVDAMRSAGRIVVGTDLYYGTPAVDFLSAPLPSPGCFASVATNGPFNQLDAFIARGRALLAAGVTESLVLLWRHDAFMADCRADALNNAAFIVGCNWRVRWIPETTQSPRWSCSWVVWRADHAGPPATLHLRRGR